MKKDTSWGKMADWYNEVVNDPDSYQRKVILPNVLRIVAPKSGMKILDLACGQGFFSHEMAKAGAKVAGVDISPELIEKAAEKKASDSLVGPPSGLGLTRSPEVFFSAAATDLSILDAKKFDVVICILAIQNIENISKVFKEVARILEPKGKFVIILNHPAFRIPKKSSWSFDEENKIQYRRVDEYLSDSYAEIETTFSFHRPIQTYSKILANSGFAISRIEEWTSHKQSQAGPRQAPEDRARREIPLFMCLECVKIA